MHPSDKNFIEIFSDDDDATISSANPSLRCCRRNKRSDERKFGVRPDPFAFLRGKPAPQANANAQKERRPSGPEADTCGVVPAGQGSCGSCCGLGGAKGPARAAVAILAAWAIGKPPGSPLFDRRPFLPHVPAPSSEQTSPRSAQRRAILG